MRALLTQSNMVHFRDSLQRRTSIVHLFKNNLVEYIMFIKYVLFYLLLIIEE